MQRELDVVIVGGGPAGISTALHLQAASPHARVVVLEKERYPREKICAGGIGARAFRILEKLDAGVDCPCVPLDAVAMRIAGETVVVREPNCGAVVRRIEFDHAFAKLAAARGIDIRDGCAVERVHVGDHGVTVETQADVLRAKLVVGADGVAGIVRRQTGFPRGELRAQVVELDTEGTPHDLPRDTVVFDFQTSELAGYAWDFPTQVAGEPLICRGVYVLHDRPHAPAEPRTRLQTYLAERGLDITRYRIKQFAERGFEPGAEIAAPRVLLVGEAAGIDIATGEGIGQAIEYGMLAGRYLADAFERESFLFSTWTQTVMRRHLGKQLRIRHLCYRVFYGRHRPRLARMLPKLEMWFRVGVQDFAGAPLSKLALAQGAAIFLGQLAREGMRGVES